MEFLNFLNPNQEQNTEKSHYFIGNVIDNKNLIIKLKNLNKKIKKSFQLQESHHNNLFTSNLIYLGYFDYNTAQVYMNDIYQYLLTSVSKKFSPLDCQITNFKIDRDSTYFKIALQYKDQHDYLSQSIIPYLYQKGIVPVLGNKKFDRKGTIDCIFFKHSNIIKSKKFRIKMNVPTDEFVIQNLCLIKGTPVKLRSGTPSIHDQMTYEVISEYNYPFQGKLGSNNNVSSLMNQSPPVTSNQSNNNINVSNIPSSPFNVNNNNKNSNNSNSNTLGKNNNNKNLNNNNNKTTSNNKNNLNNNKNNSTNNNKNNSKKKNQGLMNLFR